MKNPIQLARECGFNPLTPDSSFFTADKQQITALISRVREEAIRECLDLSIEWEKLSVDPQNIVDEIRALLNQSDGAPRKDVPDVDYPECSGDPSSCPENEGYGCCAKDALTPNAALRGGEAVPLESTVIRGHDEH